MTRVIAELGSNHNRELERALALLDAAAAAGADAAKLQVFRIEDLFAPEILAARADLRARAAWELPMELLAPIADRCRELGLELGAAAFGLWAIEPLERHVSFFKVASYELLWQQLIHAVAATGKPLVLSTGMASLAEIDAAVETARDAGCRDLRLLHCVSGYPTPPDQCNLAAIGALRERYGCEVGWSDHSARPEIVRRAVHHWGASDVELHVDLDGAGHEAGAHNWTPATLRELIDHLGDPEAEGLAAAKGSTAPGAKDLAAPEAKDSAPEAKDLAAADGDGIKRAMPIEQPDVAWRADPLDGLRPLRATRLACSE